MSHIDPNAEAYYVGLMNACGYRDKDLHKPIIGIVNSWNEVNPGHKPLKELAQYVKEGVWAAGAPPNLTCPLPATVWPSSGHAVRIAQPGPDCRLHRNHGAGPQF